MQPFPDPDGVYSLPSLKTEYVYRDDGLVEREIRGTVDPADGTRETVFQYDALGRLTTKTLPDPDGGGPGVSPVYSYTYDSICPFFEEGWTGCRRAC